MKSKTSKTVEMDVRRICIEMEKYKELGIDELVDEYVYHEMLDCAGKLDDTGIELVNQIRIAISKRFGNIEAVDDHVSVIVEEQMRSETLSEEFMDAMEDAYYAYDLAELGY